MAVLLVADLAPIRPQVSRLEERGFIGSESGRFGVNLKNRHTDLKQTNRNAVTFVVKPMRVGYSVLVCATIDWESRPASG
jgi:hypothetical protein